MGFNINRINRTIERQRSKPDDTIPSIIGIVGDNSIKGIFGERALEEFKDSIMDVVSSIPIKDLGGGEALRELEDIINTLLVSTSLEVLVGEPRSKNAMFLDNYIDNRINLILRKDGE